VYVDQGGWSPISIQCWPQGTTSQIPTDSEALDIIITGRRMMAGAPPPPPVSAERGGDEGEVAMKAIQERLGEVRLYRIPENVTVAAKSQKQVAMITQPAVKIRSILRLRPQLGDFEQPLERVLITKNRTAEGLGLPLPAGKVALFARRNGRRILLGEGRIDDHAVGEKVEIPVATATGVIARQTMFRRWKGDNRAPGYELVLANDMARPQAVEVEFPLEAKAFAPHKLIKRDGWMLWQVTVPANGQAKLRWRAD
jgi:hypothetical protein